MRKFVAVTALLIAGFLAGTGVVFGATPVGATYTGTTSHKLFIQIYVRHSKVVEINYAASFACAAPGPATRSGGSDVSSSLRISRTGKFGGKVTITPHGTTKYDYVTVSGKFTGSKVTGSFDETWKPGPAGLCNSGAVSFNASA